MDATLDWPEDSPQDHAATLEAFQDALPEHLEAAAEEIALRVQADAAREVNVDTGRLRSSLDHEVERIATHTVKAAIGSDVEYAPFVEMDYPFLRPALEENHDLIEQRIGAAIEDAWAEVT